MTTNHHNKLNIILSMFCATDWLYST